MHSVHCTYLAIFCMTSVETSTPSGTFTTASGFPAYLSLVKTSNVTNSSRGIFAILLVVGAKLSKTVWMLRTYIRN